MEFQLVNIHGYEYRHYKDMMWGIIEVYEKCNVFVENSEVTVINHTKELLHLMYKNSTITAKVQGNNSYVLDVYQKQNPHYVHVFISPNSLYIPLHKPEFPFVVVGGKKY